MGEHWSYCLMHHGIQGQKWGVRRFQNEDGSLTTEGKKRYGSLVDAMAKSKKAAENRDKKLKELVEYRKSKGYKGKNAIDEYNFDKEQIKKDENFKKLRSDYSRAESVLGRWNEKAVTQLYDAYGQDGEEFVNQIFQNWKNWYNNK